MKATIIWELTPYESRQLCEILEQRKLDAREHSTEVRSEDVKLADALWIESLFIEHILESSQQ